MIDRKKLLNEIIKLNKNNNIKISNVRTHLKASEAYVDVEFNYSDNDTWTGSLPFHYRRAGLFLDDPKEIIKFIHDSYNFLDKESVGEWVKKEKEVWATQHSNKTVTKEFFNSLLNLKWNCVSCDFPVNPNWARRIQDIKEMGYFLSTDRKSCSKCGKTTTHMLLIPLPKSTVTGYETWSAKLRRRIIKLLGNFDIYESKKAASTSTLLPDHKFPEIRWDENTKADSLEDLTDKEIKEKFQLMSNQRNLQKREVCRKCFQTNRRGTIFGIEYFYKGSKDWPKRVPKTGKAAEAGCVGCPWYDIQAWRDSLNKKLD